MRLELMDGALWGGVLAGGFELRDGAALHEGSILVLLLELRRLDAPGCLRCLQIDGLEAINWQIVDFGSAPGAERRLSRGQPACSLQCLPAAAANLHSTKL